MNEIPPPHETEPAPHALTEEKPSIRASQEEFIDEMASPSMDKSEYAQQKGKSPALRPDTEAEETPRHEQH